MGKKFRTVLNKYSYFKLSSLVLGRSRFLSLPPPPPLIGGGRHSHSDDLPCYILVRNVHSKLTLLMSGHWCCICFSPPIHWFLLQNYYLGLLQQEPVRLNLLEQHAQAGAAAAANPS